MNRFKDTLGTVKRLMSYIIMRHKFIFTVVVVCVLLNSFVTVASSVYMQILIDDYITPLITEGGSGADGDDIFSGRNRDHICGRSFVGADIQQDDGQSISGNA